MPPPPERERITAVGIDLDAPTADGACPALSRAMVTTGVCTAHPIRPMICRLWGTVASMPRPNGCAPDDGVLHDAAAMEVLTASARPAVTATPACAPCWLRARPIPRPAR